MNANAAMPQLPQMYRYTTVKEAADAMPIFDPDDEIYGSSATFVARVRALQHYHAWDDRLVLFAAQQKLVGSAKRWNDTSLVLFDTFEAFANHLQAKHFQIWSMMPTFTRNWCACKAWRT